MSEVLSKISYDYKYVYFTFLHNREVHIGEQNQQNHILSEGSDMDFKANLNVFAFECPK